MTVLQQGELERKRKHFSSMCHPSPTIRTRSVLCLLMVGIVLHRKKPLFCFFCSKLSFGVATLKKPFLPPPSVHLGNYIKLFSSLYGALLDRANKIKKECAFPIFTFTHEFRLKILSGYTLRTLLQLFEGAFHFCLCTFVFIIVN